MQSIFQAGTLLLGLLLWGPAVGMAVFAVPSVLWVRAEKLPDCAWPVDVGPGGVLQCSPCLHPSLSLHVAQMPPPGPQQIGSGLSKAACLPTPSLLTP